MNNFQITPGIKDEDFIRGEVPMTKEEVRVISISKLHLSKDSIVYDIGSGTGSIAVEIARLSSDIKVYAIEINEEGIELIKKNSEKFFVSNIIPVKGLAPDVFKTIEKPTHAFIGGTKGHLTEILNSLYKMNPKMRIVMNSVSMESICEMQKVLTQFSVTDVDIAQIAVTKTKKIGNYNMLNANNPVFIFSFSFSQNI